MNMWRTLRGDYVILICAICTVWSQQCRDTGWEKVTGMRPESVKSSSILYNGIDSQGITTTCFNKCKTANCTAFVIDVERGGCFSVEPDSDEFIPEPNATFYHQICIEVPTACSQNRLWQVERTLGAILVDTSTVWLPEVMTRTQCYERCIAAGSGCKSAQFRTSKDLRIGDTRGKCALSTLDRATRPQAYRASMYRDEYLQNQCHDLYIPFSDHRGMSLNARGCWFFDRGPVQTRTDFCSYSEFRNTTMPYSDLKLPGLDFKECEERCDMGNDGFICRGYTVYRPPLEQPLCLLHAEESITAGPSSLVDTRDAYFKEREPCLDLKVQCTNTTLRVVLTTVDAFWGRIYVSGWGELCGVHGNGHNLTALVLPMPKEENLVASGTTDCGLTPAFSVDNSNHTRAVLWATVIVQFNPIIQKLGDQAVRVGCSLDGDEPPQPRNITVHSDVHFLDPNAGVPPIVSTVVNTSSEAPIVRMRILDDGNSKDASVTHLGQKLMLKIEITPPDGPYDISAGHLVASSAGGDSSYLLIDEMGCPTDPGTFPPLQRDPTDNSSLIARFTAFKFPNSQLVRFDVVVRFCSEKCEPARCKNGILSYGRKRRSIFPSTTVANVSEISEDKTPDELPLQLSIIVQSPVVSPDPLLSREISAPDTVLIAGGQSIEGLLCVDAGLALGLLIFWLIIQIVLTAGCLVAVKRYRRMARRAEDDRADILARHLYGIHGGNFEVARRVRWADHNSSSIS